MSFEYRALFVQTNFRIFEKLLNLEIPALFEMVKTEVSFIFCRCSLFIVQGESDSRCLVSDLFDVNVSSTVEEMSAKTEIRIPWGSGIVGHVAASAKKVNIADCYADERFNPVSES